MLERVPDDKLGWRPHPKSMSLGELASHLATTAGGIAGVAQLDSMDYSEVKPPVAPAKASDLVRMFDESLNSAKDSLAQFDDARLMGNWSLTKDSKAMLTMPRIALLRSIMLNHAYHHRGQLTVYLRLLNVPLPPVYGPTADENPFGG